MKNCIQNSIKKVISMSKIFLLLFLFSCSVSQGKSNNFKLKKIGEISYKVFDQYMSIPNEVYFSDKDIFHFTNIKSQNQIIIDLKNNQKYTFGTKGKGPGEFLFSNAFVEFKNNKYCLDQFSRKIVVYDSLNQFLFGQRNREYSLLDLEKNNNYLLGITGLLENSFNLYFFNSELKVIKKQKIEFPYLKSYSNIERVNLFASSKFLCIQNKLFQIFKYQPKIIIYNLETFKSKEINYKQNLPYVPEKPGFHKNWFGGSFICRSIGYDKNKIYFKLDNNFMSEKNRKISLYCLNLRTNKFEKMELDENIDLKENISIDNGFLYIFNNDDEQIIKYDLIEE